MSRVKETHLLTPRAEANPLRQCVCFGLCLRPDCRSPQRGEKSELGLSPTHSTSCVVPFSDPQRHFTEVILNPPVNEENKEVTFSPFNRKYKAFFLQSHRMYQGQSQEFHSLQKHCTPASRSHRGSYTAAGPRGIFLDLIQVTLL